MKISTQVAALILAALSLIGIVALSALKLDVPPALTYVLASAAAVAIGVQAISGIAPGALMSGKPTLGIATSLAKLLRGVPPLYIEEWIDVSNYTSTMLELWQLDYIRRNKKGVIIGLQNADDARYFRDVAFPTLKHAYYVDLLGRDLSIPETGSYCAIDIESGCFTASGDISTEVQAQLDAGVRVMIYGNANSMRPIIGDSTALSIYPLWWANYGTPDLSRFVPFNGWGWPMIMQYNSEGAFGINFDLDAVFYLAPPDDPIPTPAPAPMPRNVAHVTVEFEDGAVQVLNA